METFFIKSWYWIRGIWAAGSLVSCALFLLLGVVIMPILLNGKFNPIYGPKKGEPWEPHKMGLFPFYMFTRCYDYAKALLFDGFAKRKFAASRDIFRAQVNRPTIFLSWLLVLVYWIMIANLVGFVFLEALEKSGWLR